MQLSKFMLLLVSIVTFSFLLTVSTTFLKSAELEQIKEEYTFAVVPQGPPSIMNEKWLPFIDQLSQDTGLKLDIKLYANMKDFEKDLREGNVDFAYMNPIQAIMAWHDSGYLPLVRSRKLIRGYVFVKKDSSIKTFDDLAGREIALVGSENVCSIVIRHDIQDLNVLSRYVGNTENVYRNVELDETAAGGTLDFVFDQDLLKMNQMFNMIHSTEPLSPHPISAHPSVLHSVRTLITEAVLKYASDKNMLRRLGLEDPVKANYDQDYLPLERRLAESSKGTS